MLCSCRRNTTTLSVSLFLSCSLCPLTPPSFWYPYSPPACPHASTKPTTTSAPVVPLGTYQPRATRWTVRSLPSQVVGRRPKPARVTTAMGARRRGAIGACAGTPTVRAACGGRRVARSGATRARRPRRGPPRSAGILPRRERSDSVRATAQTRRRTRRSPGTPGRSTWMPSKAAKRIDTGSIRGARRDGRRWWTRAGRRAGSTGTRSSAV